MKKRADNVGKFIGDLFEGQVSVPSASIIPTEEKPKTDYIKSFQSENKYQWPIQVSPVNEKPSSLKDRDAWDKIDENKKPWVVGTFTPGQYLNPTHPEGHDGMDLVAPTGTPVYSTAPGIVKRTGNSQKGGQFIIIDHEDGVVQSYYAHLSKINVSAGQEVDHSTVIGLSGEANNAPHLHYTVKINGQLVNPANTIGKQVGSLTRTANIVYDIVNLFNKYSADNIKKETRISQLEKIAASLKI